MFWLLFKISLLPLLALGENTHTHTLLAMHTVGSWKTTISVNGGGKEGRKWGDTHRDTVSIVLFSSPHGRPHCRPIKSWYDLMTHTLFWQCIQSAAFNFQMAKKWTPSSLITWCTIEWNKPWNKPCSVTHHVVRLQWSFFVLVVGIKTSELC